MATHSSILAWRIPQTEEPGGLYSMGLQRVGRECMSNRDTEQQRHKVDIFFVSFYYHLRVNLSEAGIL